MDLPGEFSQTDPPEELKRALAEGVRPCGSGRYEIVWQEGDSKGLPVTGWCAEPLCLQTGSCTGPRFVVHPQQYTNADPDHPARRQRKLTAREVIAAVKAMGRLAYRQTGVPDNRSDRQIARHVGLVWKRMREAIGDSTGGWTP